MKKMMKKENGFTLIELIIVIAILAIIAAVAIPNILGAVDNSRKSTDIANAKIIANAAAQVMAKDEDAASAEFLTTAALSLTRVDGSATASTGGADDILFSDKLYLELNSNPPVPKYKGGAITEDSFFLVITAEDAVQVYVNANPAGTAEVGAEGAVMLYPIPSTDYKIN